MFGFQEFVILILVLAVVLVAMGVKSVPRAPNIPLNDSDATPAPCGPAST